jgi:hypothetical protein
MMSADYLLFYGSTAIVLLLNILLLWKRRLQGAVSTGIQVVYTVYFNYGLYFDSAWGAALAWWFYLIMINCLHFVVLITVLTNYYILEKRATAKRD